MKGKVVAITGGTAGIGKATVIKMATFGCKVIILARDLTKALGVIDEIKTTFPTADIDIVYMDLADLGSVRNAAAELKSKYGILDILINNAGGVFEKRILTRDGFETGFQVNHLSHYYLTRLLVNNMVIAKNGRIINVASDLHKFGKINLKNLNGELNYGAWKQYNAVKLMNVMFTKSLANKYPGINCFSLHPGVVRSSFGNNNSGFIGLFNKLPFLISVEDGAKTSVYLATQELDKLKNGYYYKKSALAISSVHSHDVEMQNELWNVSEDLLKEKGFVIG